MDTNVTETLKVIDNEISIALNTISELEEKLNTIRTDDEGNVLKDECVVLKDKFASFNKSLQELTRMLAEIGIINKEDSEGL